MTDETNGSGVGEQKEPLAAERERIARCLRAEAHPRNDAEWNRAMLFAAGCALAQYDRNDAHSFCVNRETCPRCSLLGADTAGPDQGFASMCARCGRGLVSAGEWCCGGFTPATPDADDASEPCDHATTEFVNDVAGWCCSHCGAAVDPDARAADDWCSRCNNGADVRCDACSRGPDAASTGAREGLSDEEFESLDEAFGDAFTVKWQRAIERIVAARESAAATRARGEGAAAERRIERALALLDGWEHDAPGLVNETFAGRLREVLRRDPAPVRLRSES